MSTEINQYDKINVANMKAILHHNNYLVRRYIYKYLEIRLFKENSIDNYLDKQLSIADPLKRYNLETVDT